MSLKITWKRGPYKGTYAAQIKGPAVGAVDGRLLVSGGISSPGGATECGFWLNIDDTVKSMPSMVVPGKNLEDASGVWQSLPPLPLRPGWTSGAAVAGGLAVVGGRREGRATPEVLFLKAQPGAAWERLPDRPTPAMVATTMAHGDFLYTAFGTDWQPHEHAVEDTNIYRMDVANRSEWEIVTRFPGAPRWMGGLAVCNGKMYVIGGRDWPLEVITDIQPHNAYDIASGLFADDRSGPKELVAYSEMWEYDFDADKWQELPHPPRAFVADTFTVADRWIVVPGGRSWVVYPEGAAVRIMSHHFELEMGCYSHEVWAYDTHTSEWLFLDPLPYGVCSHRVSTWKDRAYIVGNEVLDRKRGNSYGTVFIGQIEVGA